MLMLGDLNSIEEWLLNQPLGLVLFLQDIYSASREKGFEPRIHLHPKPHITESEIVAFEQYLRNQSKARKRKPLDS